MGEAHTRQRNPEDSASNKDRIKMRRSSPMTDAALRTDGLPEGQPQMGLTAFPAGQDV